MPSLRLLWLSCMMIYSLRAIRHGNYNEEDVGWLCAKVIIRPCTFGSEFGLWLIYACLQTLVSLDTLFWQRDNIWLCFWTFQVPIEEPAVNKDLCQVLKGRAVLSLWLDYCKCWQFKTTISYPYVASQLRLFSETIAKSPITDYIYNIIYMWLSKSLKSYVTAALSLIPRLSRTYTLPKSKLL